MRKLCDNLLVCLLLTSCLPESNLAKKEEESTPTPTVLVGEDPLAQYQWHLINTGSNYVNSGDNGISGADINLRTLHDDNITGYGIKVIVSDQEAQLSHEDLDPNKDISISKNFKTINSGHGILGQNPFTAKANASHGTAVSGIIAAAMNNAVGGKGVSPEATIGNYNFLAFPSSAYYHTQLAAQATAANNSAVDVFNYSWGAMTCFLSSPSSNFQSALLNGITNYRSGRGALYIKAAGNEYLDYKENCLEGHGTTPAYYLGNANFEGDNNTPYLINVGATNAAGTSANYSTPGANLWVSAPGGDTSSQSYPAGILSTDVTGCETNAGYAVSSKSSSFERGTSGLNTNCKYTSELQGTSFAAPVVSGVVALILQSKPDLTWRDVKYILAKTARFPSNPVTPQHLYNNSITSLISDTDRNTFNSNVPGNYTYDRGTVYNTTGLRFHNWYGFGLVDSTAAVAMASNNYASPFTGKAFTETTYDFGALSTTIPDGTSAGTGVSFTYAQPDNFIIESIGIELSTANAKASEIGIELSFTPDGGGSTVNATIINANNFSTTNNYINFKVISNAFYMMDAKGTWNVRIIDAYANSSTSSVTGLKLIYYGHNP